MHHAHFFAPSTHGLCWTLRVWGTHCPIKAAIIWINSIGRFSADGFHAVTWPNNRTFSHFHVRFRWFVSVRIPKLAGKEHTQTTHDDAYVLLLFPFGRCFIWCWSLNTAQFVCMYTAQQTPTSLNNSFFIFYVCAFFSLCECASFLNLCLSIFLLKCLSKQNSVTPTTENIVTDSWIIYFQDLVSIYVCLMLLLLLSACCCFACCPVCGP